MKHIFTSSALVAVLGFVLAGAPVSVHAQSTNAAPATASTDTSTPPAATPKKKKGKSQFTAYTGTLKALSDTSATVTTSKGDITLAIDATTKFQVAKKAAKASDFAVGDAVTGSYATGADGSLTAHSIHKKK